jgi:glutamate-ammonia-ligase adenylyltransferase
LSAPKQLREAGQSRAAQASAGSCFRHPERSRLNLERISKAAPAGVMEAIQPLLADVPDPDAALNLFERLTETAPVELFQLFDKHHVLIHYSLAIFGYSQFLGETLLHNLDLFQHLLRSGYLDRTHSQEEFREAFGRFRARSVETDIALLLARFKRREYIRIVLRDVLELASLAETTGEISSLSDVLIEEALRDSEAVLHKRYGLPQHRDHEGRVVQTPFSVLALGKLGGNELNYSSDIDLVFIFGDGEPDGDAPISPREYFIRLAQQVTDVLSRVTKEGAVFRIDLRLRPQGREGESAVSLSHALRYYSSGAHDWERQAMIKVRHCTGDRALARKFIRSVQPHIYSDALNFAAIETAMAARDLIFDARKTAVARDADAINVKLDRGGIRDIEFLVQCMQRVYGGREAWLRSGGTLFSLQKLHDKRHITGNEFHQLTSAYEFLRTIEHRLQLRHGQQTHRLPTNEDDLAILARSISEVENRTIAGADLVRLVRERMAQVVAIYDRIIHQQQQAENQVAKGFELRGESSEPGHLHSDHQILQRLMLDAPALYEIAAREDLPGHARRNLFRFLGSAFTSAERYAAVLAAPEALQKALELFRYSEFLSDILVQHPEDIAALNELRTSSPRHQSELPFSVNTSIRGGHNQALLDYLSSPGISHTDKLSLLRRRYRHRLFLSGARDIVEGRPVASGFSDTTAAADEAIESALAITGRCKGFAVLALGRLGTGEFDCLSDADLLFVREKKLGANSAANIAGEVVQTLSAYTNEGTVLAVDVRLRPRGGEGEITITPEQLQAYFLTDALPWEGLTYTKLRFVAGDKRLAQKAIFAAQDLRERFARDPGFGSSVREMRGKLEKQDKAPNLKTGAGGMYDIDFLISYLLIKQGIHTAEGNTRHRLQKLGHAAVLKQADLQTLLDAVDLFRTVEHAIRLATGRPGKWLPVSEQARCSVEQLTRHMLNVDPGVGIESHLIETCRHVRGIYDATLLNG